MPSTLPSTGEVEMKVGIIGVGAVGTACAKAMLLRGSCHEIVLLDLKERDLHSQGVANDLSHGEPLCPATRISVGDYSDLRDASAVVITAGINEQAGGATDPKDTLGRLRLLPDNAKKYRKIVPQILDVIKTAPIVVVTDPPDPLADVVREFTTSTPVLSTGTFLDTLRFRVQLARKLGCHANSVEAIVIGEHGRSQVHVWSSARIGGQAVLDRAAQQGLDLAAFRKEVEAAVGLANIQIITGTGASQHGIGIVTARIVEAILRDEKLIAPIGAWQPQFRVTLSLPGVIGKQGVSTLPTPLLSDEETAALENSAAVITEALRNFRQGADCDSTSP